MKSTLSFRFSTKRLFVLTLVSFVAVAALLGVAASANKANRAAKARADQAANTKSGINPNFQNDKQPNAPAAAVITATLTDNITAATKVAPGGTINYTAVITNNGAASPADDATNLNYSDPLDANTTLVAGSVHASPLAFDDTYNWVGNTFLDTAARALPAVTANDVAVNAPGGTDTFTLTAIAGGATALGGVVTLASPSGAFTYTPPLGRPNVADGATVQDSFTYTITNSANPTLIGTGTVRINLTGRVWYLMAGASGDGRSNTPSGSPSAMSTAADKSTDFFYIFSNAGSLNGLFTVDAGQQLLGQGVNLVVNAITLFTSAAPTPTTTNTAGNCVTLAGAPGNNTVSGFNIGNCTGGIAIAGSNVGTLTVGTLSINTNGGGLDLTGVGTPTVNVVLGGLTSSSGAKNVNLVGLNGTIDLAGGTLSGAAGNSFDVNGGAATISYTGNITNSGGKQVNIANMTGGSALFSGAVNGTGTGINLVTNPGATITFRGGVVLSTGANPAFTATGPGPAATSGGTVNVCDENPCVPGSTGALVNTLTTTSATALNVVNTTIGANRLEFRSINSTTASANGIVLNNTGSSGGLTVNGIGTTAGTGGTISNKTGNGVTLTSTSSVTLKNMNLTGNGTSQVVAGSSSSCGGDIVTGNNLSCVANAFLSTVTGATFDNVSVTGSGQQGINGNAVNGLTINNCTITGNGNESFEDGIILQNTTGTLSITGTNVRDNRARELHIGNGSGTMTFNTSTSQYGHTAAGTGTAESQQGILMQLFGTSNTTISATTLTMSNNEGIGFTANAFQINADNGGPIVNGSITSSTFDNNAAHVFVNVGGTSTVTFDTMNNTTMTRAALQAINYTVLGGSTAITANVTGTISGNTIGTAGANGCTTAGTNCHAIDINSGEQWNGQMHLKIASNTIQKVAQGIIFTLGGGNGVTPQVHAKVTGNSVTNSTLTSAGEAIKLNTTVTSTNPTISVCWDVGGGGALNNTVTGDWATGSSQASLFLRQRFSGNASIRLPGYGGGSADNAAVTTYLNGRNSITAGPSPGQVAVLVTHSGVTPFTGGAACTTPATPNPADDSVRNRIDNVIDSHSSASVMAQAKTELAKAPVLQTPVTQISTKGGIASVLAKATPKASAAEMARIYRSERPLSHHAVRRIFDQQPNAPASGETVTLNTIATFPAGGKSITVKYSATVNAPPLARQVSTQGTVTANGGAISVLTDDPEPAGSANPTVTLVDTTMTWNGSTSTDWNTATNWTPPAGGTQYAPGVSNPAVNDVVIPNVGNQPNISATDIDIFSLNLSNGRTLTINSGRTLTIDGAAATSDLTLDGIISGGALNFAGAGPHVINNAGGTGSLSSTNVMTLLSPASVTLNQNLQAGAVAVNSGATFNITNRTLSLNGSGAALAVGGTLTTTGSTVIFNGTAAQTAAGVAYNNLTINNTIGTNITGVTLTGNATVNGVLTLTSSDLDTGAFTLTQPNTTASTGVSDVVGTVTRTGAPLPAATVLTYGNPNNQITLSAAGTKPTSLTVAIAKAAPANPNGYAAAVQRTYTVSQIGGSGFTSTVRFHYLDTELNGNIEASLNLRRLRTSDNHWVAALPTTRDTTNNWVETTGVLATDLVTRWTMSSLAPTASNGVVSGRIVDNNGNGVEGAVVRLGGTQNRKFITDANGFYRFDDV
ncbi:MAG TPA: hypothetical protein VIF64_23305, partial [Pyrinomonadaceae bacterium]